MSFPIYWLSPVAWSVDTSFEQGSGFNRQVLWVEEVWDEYVFWWDDWTNYYSAYNWVSSINWNKVSPFFRVRKDNYLPDSNSNLWGNFNAQFTDSYNFCNDASYIYTVWFFTKYWNDTTNWIVKINVDDLTINTANTWTWFSNTSVKKIYLANGYLFVTLATAWTYNGWVSTRLYIIDTSLNTDVAKTDLFLPNNTISCIFQQADGKVVISWAFTQMWWTTQNRIVRYNTDRTIDTTFTTNVWTWPNSWALTIKQLSDGKLVLWWAFTSFNGTSSQRIIVLNTDWTIATAVASGFNTWQVNDIAVDWSDNIFCWGTFTSYAWTARILAKLSSTLVLDWTFAPIWMNVGISSLLIDGNNLLVWWWFNAVGGVSVSGIFSTDLVNGTLTSNFYWWVNDNWLSGNIYQLLSIGNYIYLSGFIAQYANNKTYSWETTTLVNYIDKNWLLIKSLDKFYYTGGTYNISEVIKNWTDIYITTSNNTWYWLVNTIWVLKSENKIVNKNFVSNVPWWILWWIYDNWLIIVWTFTSPKNRICKLLDDWTVDSSFDIWTWFNDRVFWITKLANWNYLITWNFSTYKWVTTNRVMIVDNVWNKIWTFAEWTWFNASAFANTKSIELSNWNYLAYGNFTSYKSVACNRAIQIDTSWTQVSWLSSNFNSRVRKAVEHNGKVYFVWLFTTFWATTVNRIACIDLATWTLENIFWTGFNWEATNCIIDSEWKLVVTGNFTTYNWQTVGNVVRIFIS